MTEASTIRPDALTPGLRRALQASVEAGEFASLDEALGDAVASWAADREKRLDIWRSQIRRSLEDPRPSILLEEAFDRIERLHAERVAGAKADEAA